MNYDYKAARRQIEDMTLMYRRLKYKGMLDERSRKFLLESINELEEEISEAKRKMATLDGHHFSEVKQKFNYSHYTVFLSNQQALSISGQSDAWGGVSIE